MSELAILGGAPVIPDPLPRYRSVGAAEREAVCRVIDDDCLSGFYGSWGEEFFGGPRVREFEAAWAARFGVRHVVSVNSATSGLFAAMGAIGVGPGDEVIVPPYTMSATAMAPLVYGAVPVFADIEPETFCIDPARVRDLVTPRTRAIVAVNLFGHPARLAELRALADERGLKLVEDNAQGPLAEEGGRLAGTIGHIGVFSLNYHKHIHTGEGGMCATEDDDLAQRLRLIRNHGENVVEPLGIAEEAAGLVGFNYRMTELSAAVGIAQLAAVDAHVGPRRRLAERLTEGVLGLEGVTPPLVREGCRHVYYTWAVRLDEAALGVSRAAFLSALAAEGMPLYGGYVRPLYELPVFRRRAGFPFRFSDRRYGPGLCPVAERMHGHELALFETCAVATTPETEARLVEAFRKVHRLRHELHRLEPAEVAR